MHRVPGAGQNDVSNSGASVPEPPDGTSCPRHNLKHNREIQYEDQERSNRPPNKVAMTNPSETPSKPPASRWRNRLLTLLFIAGVSSFIWSQLPDGGYPTDLSKIGTGRPALVLAHDSNYSGGMEVMYLMNEIRDDYAARVDFLVAHLGMADGQEFARRHGARDGVVLLFSGDGRNVGVLAKPESIDELRLALNQAFSF
jgi:hypothetical protein